VLYSVAVLGRPTSLGDLDRSLLVPALVSAGSSPASSLSDSSDGAVFPILGTGPFVSGPEHLLLPPLILVFLQGIGGPPYVGNAGPFCSQISLRGGAVPIFDGAHFRDALLPPEGVSQDFLPGLSHRIFPPQPVFESNEAPFPTNWKELGHFWILFPRILAA